jgi:hypothetical protein
MKKFLQLILIFGAIFFLFVKSVYATSGSCSSHGGVNCAMGIQSNGAVYCNDGWAGSSALYDYALACQNVMDPVCVQKTAEYIRGRDIAVNDSTAKIKDLQAKLTATSDPVARDEIETQLNSLYTMRSAQTQTYIGYIIKDCKKKPVPTADDNNRSCIVKFPNSVWDGKDVVNNQIVCICKTGFAWNDDRTFCIPASLLMPTLFPKIVTQPIITAPKAETTPDKADQGIKVKQPVKPLEKLTDEVKQNLNSPIVNGATPTEITDAEDLIGKINKPEVQIVKPMVKNEVSKPLYAKAWGWILKIFGIK